MRTKCRKEILELHQFYEYWYNGAAPRTDEAFERCSRVLAPGFVLVSPSGRLTDRDKLLQGIKLSWGSWRGQRVATSRIRISSFQLHRTEGDLAVVTYQEWQEGRGKTTGRLTTAIFRRNDDAPNGVEWLHVHETWLPGR